MTLTTQSLLDAMRVIGVDRAADRDYTVLGLMGPAGLYAGVRIVTDDTLLDYREDWSRVRSPSRAARRRRHGHRQNIVMLAAPKMTAYSIDGGHTLVMHSAMVDVLMER